jgi:MoaA/NifB/PqqE/SkfB family radical SAM enzyme
MFRAGPEIVVVSITNKCNMACPQCAYPRLAPQRAQFMSGSVFLDVLGQCGDAGVSTIRFLGLSEPTLHAQLPEFLDSARIRAIKTELLSNGTFAFRPKMATKLLKSPPDQLEVSIDAWNSRQYSTYRGKGERFFIT